MRIINILLGLSFSMCGWSQSLDIRRRDMVSPWGSSGYSMEQIRDGFTDPVCNCDRVRITDLVSQIRNEDPNRLNPFLGTHRTMDGSTGALVTFQLFNQNVNVNLPVLAINTLHTIENIKTHVEQQNERAKVIREYSLHLENQLQNSIGANAQLAEKARGLGDRLQSNTTAFRKRGSEYLTSLSYTLAISAGLTNEQIESNAAAERLANDPFRFNTYSSSEVGAKNIGKELNAALEARDYEAAVGLKESLLYDIDPNGRDADQAGAAFNDDGILIPENADSSLPVSPLAGYQLKSRGAEGRQWVQRLANEYQIAWARTNGLAELNSERQFYYYSGIVALRSADQAMNESRDEAITWLFVSRALLDASMGFIDGVGEQLLESAKGLSMAAYRNLWLYYTYKTDKRRFWEYVKESVMNMPKVANALVVEYKEKYNKLLSGTAYERGVLAGQLATEVVIDLATDGVTKLNRISKGSDRLKDHVFRASDKTTENFMEKARKLPPNLGKAAADKSLSRAQRANAISFHQVLSESPNHKVRDLADKYAADSAYNPRPYGLAKDLPHRNIQITNIYSGDDVNKYFKYEYDYKKPFIETPVIEFTSNRTARYGRVHRPGHPEGAWLFRFDERITMSYDDVIRHARETMAIPGDKPLAFSIVEVGPGTPLLRGTARSVGGKRGGGIQYYSPNDPKLFKYTEMTHELWEKMKRERDGL